DYLESLGVSCIYLNPIFKAHSNHRYDTGDYLTIDPLLGDEKDFKKLCSDAKKKGISIILDGVFSHTGDDSVYFNKYSNYPSVGAYQSQNSPYYSWYKVKSFPDDYESWWGIKILPEVTEENEEFLEFITGENGVLRKWMKLGADGWRLDVADELPDVFLDRLREAVKAEKEDALVLGEVWEDASNKVSYSVRRRYLLGKQLDSVMNYPFADAIIHFVRTGDTSSFSETVMTVLENYPKTVVDVLMNHIGSHDTMRVINALAGESLVNKPRSWQSGKILSPENYKRGIQLVKLASCIQFTLPGIPSIYYGDEIGMQGYADPFNRGCFIEEKAEKSLVAHYRKLGEIRRNNSCFREGDFRFISCERACIAYVREDENESILTIANRNETDIEYYLHEEWHSAEVLMGEDVCSYFVRVPAMSAVILRRRK
ncbi:MAG: alpha-glucosidase C-terminal domain-containing protein, partial [Clostridia bacterium]|nr:alpha-glucosidase C-terminal domain-containing protein [Clostridia bacterium]